VFQRFKLESLKSSQALKRGPSQFWKPIPGIPTTIKTMGANITTIAYLRVSLIEIGSTIILTVVEAQGYVSCREGTIFCCFCVGDSLGILSW